MIAVPGKKLVRGYARTGLQACAPLWQTFDHRTANLLTRAVSSPLIILINDQRINHDEKMTRPGVWRGICDVSKVAAISPRLTKVTQRVPAPSRSFRYHIPRRISSASWLAAENHLCNCPYASHPVDNDTNIPHRISRTLLRLPVSTSKILHGHRYSNSPVLRQCNRPSQIILKTPTIIRRYHQSKLLREAVHKPTKPALALPEDKSAHHNGKAPLDTQNPEEVPDLMHRLHLDRIHLPTMPQFHRPTKEELLSTATGFWSRLKLRFKWASIRSNRKFNMDEITGFVSAILVGHILWLVIGTTTFISLAILAINTVFAQETLAGWIGNYLTKSSGVKVVFESAVVPKWKNGVITFKNVFVSRRPGKHAKGGVTKGSSSEAAAAAASKEVVEPAAVEDDGNYTQFDITIAEVNVTLSFSKWFNSHGLLQNVEVKGIRGVVDRTYVHWTGQENPDPKSYRHEHLPGDFEIDSFKIEDLLITLHQPKGFRPFPISIYNADLPRLRKRFLFYDFLSANSMSGEYDSSLFTIHPRQTHAMTGAELTRATADADDTPWNKQSRIRIDALNIDQLNRGVEGPFGWIHHGNVDIVADVLFPADSDESVLKVMADFYDRMEATLTSHKRAVPGAGAGAGYITPVVAPELSSDKRYLVMDLRIHLNDVRASVPLFTKDLSYVNNALVRPIVAYINSRSTFIPINCRVVKRAEDFDGSWTVYDSGLLDDLSAEVS